jgi:hypothetical protein
MKNRMFSLTSLAASLLGVGIIIAASSAHAKPNCTLSETNGVVQIKGSLEVTVHVTDEFNDKKEIIGGIPTYSVKLRPSCGDGSADGTIGVKDWGYIYGSAQTIKYSNGIEQQISDKPIVTEATIKAACKTGKTANSTATLPINWGWFVNPDSGFYTAAKASGSTGKNITVKCQRPVCTGKFEWK